MHDDDNASPSVAPQAQIDPTLKSALPDDPPKPIQLPDQPEQSSGPKDK